ncbi:MULTISPECIES: hypothetical protein [Paenibacillus]|uniref:Uncharacterized protein n=1 Tax=Paenibacillus amylolyticus TaxID=1451 RepID=A0ABD8B052_PAEAM
MKGDEVLHGRKLNSFDRVSNASAHVHNLYTAIQPFGYEIVIVHFYIRDFTEWKTRL